MEPPGTKKAPPWEGPRQFDQVTASRVVSGGAACASHAGDGAALLPSAKYDEYRRYKNRSDGGNKAEKSGRGEMRRGHDREFRVVPG